MNIPILRFNIVEYKYIPKKSLFKKKKLVEEIVSYQIELSYNLDEDRFYYSDDTKSIPTKKDLSRSIIMIYDIFKRYEKFGLKDYFKLSDNRLNMFLDNFFNCNNNESELYLKRMIFGTQPINLMLINNVLNELGIINVDFTKYYYFQYPRINFR